MTEQIPGAVDELFALQRSKITEQRIKIEAHDRSVTELLEANNKLLLENRELKVKRLPRAIWQAQTIAWVYEAFGQDSVLQRAIRLHEEATEALQAAAYRGVDPTDTNLVIIKDIAHQQVDYIFSRPPDALDRELGGVGLTLLALAATAGLDADECEQQELDRVLARPPEHWKARNENKNALGFKAPEPEPRKPHPLALPGNKSGWSNAFGDFKSGDRIKHKDGRMGWLDEALTDGEAYVTWDTGSHETVLWLELRLAP